MPHFMSWAIQCIDFPDLNMPILVAFLEFKLVRLFEELDLSGTTTLFAGKTGIVRERWMGLLSLVL
jgi:hypothetical protein